MGKFHLNNVLWCIDCEFDARLLSRTRWAVSSHAYAGAMGRVVGNVVHRTRSNGCCVGVSLRTGVVVVVAEETR